MRHHDPRDTHLSCLKISPRRRPRRAALPAWQWADADQIITLLIVIIMGTAFIAILLTAGCALVNRIIHP